MKRFFTKILAAVLIASLLSPHVQAAPTASSGTLKEVPMKGKKSSPLYPVSDEESGVEETEEETSQDPDPDPSEDEYSRALAKKNQEFFAGDADLTEILIEKPREEKRWTVMVYMIGSNLESSFGAASADISEMESAGLDYEESNLILYTGGSARWQSNIPCDRNCVLDLGLEDEKRIVASTAKNADMGAKETLSSFVNFCTEYYPAEQYALIFWDHGGGPLWGYGSDELFSGDGLLLEEMKLAMNDTVFSGYQNLSFVGFDACLMGCLENMMIWSQYADYYVSSEELEPGDGWDYRFLEILNNSDDVSRVTREIVDRFREFYEKQRSKHYNPDLTLSVCDLSQTQKVIRAVSNTAAEMTEMVQSGQYPELAEIRHVSQSFGCIGTAESGAGLDYDLVDLVNFFTTYCGETGKSTDNNPILKALSSFIVYNYSNMEEAHGVSIYHPMTNRKQYFETKDIYESLWAEEAYSGYLKAVGNIWQNAKREDWHLNPVENGGSEYLIQLSDEQKEKMIRAQYSIFLSEHPGQYRPLLLNREISPDEEGVLHLEKDPALIALCCGSDREVWPVVQTQSTKKRRIIQTKDTEFCASGVYFNSRYNTETYPATIIVQEDIPTAGLSIQTVNSVSDGWMVDGRESVNASDFDAIYYRYFDLVPVYGENGEMLPVSSWKNGDYSGRVSMNLQDSFSFEYVRSSELSAELYYVASITDADGSEYLTEPFRIEPERAYDTIRTETEAGVLTVAVYEDHAELLMYEGTDEHLVIPDEFDGVPLTVIGPWAFFKRIDMVYGWTGDHYPLKYVAIPDTVAEIRNGAFYMCADLRRVRFPAQLRVIGMQAFSVCRELQVVGIPKGVRSIGAYAFSDCSKLQRIILPKSLEEIGKGVTADCYNLSGILLSDGNLHYAVYHGGLYTKDYKTMLAYPAAKTGSYSVHEDTEVLESDCFSGTMLTEVRLPEGLREIRNYAFYRSVNLRMPYLPDSLEKVGFNVFSYSALTSFGPEFGHPDIQEIHIGRNLEKIGQGAFTGMIPRAFVVDPENACYSEKDGALLTKSGDSIREFAISVFQTLEVPEGVRDMDISILNQTIQYPYYYHDTYIYLPDSLIRITDTYFYINFFKGALRDGLVFHCSPGSYAEQFFRRQGCETYYDAKTIQQRK